MAFVRQRWSVIDETKALILILDMHMPVGSALTAVDIIRRLRASGVPGVSIYLDATTQDLAKAFGGVLLAKMRLAHELYAPS